MDIIQDRNQSVHTYNEDVAEKIINGTIQFYVEELNEFPKVMQNIENRIEMKFGLKDSVVAKIGLVFGQFHQIDKVTLYGSRATGTYRNGPDIDLTVHGTPSHRQFYDMLQQLGDLMLPYVIDLPLSDDLKSSNLINHINRRGVVFYQRMKVLQ